MNEHIENEQQPIDGIDRLAREISPENDPWPQIEQRLGSRQGTVPQGRTGWPMRALAASVAVAFVAGLIFGRQSVIDTSPSGSGTGAQASLALQGSMEAVELEYQAAFREFIPVGSSRAVLRAQTVQNIEASWGELQQAEMALLAALRDFPDNAYLNQKLLDLRSQQLGFMKQLATLDQFSRRKI